MIISSFATTEDDQKNLLKENTSVKTESVMTPYGVHIAGYFYTGDGDNNSGQKVPLEPIFGRKQSTLGDSNSTNWGIECNEVNSCSFDSEDTITDFYKSMMFTYKKASLNLRLQNENTNVEGLNKLNIQLVNGGNHWPLNNFGILGLSPRGDAGNYFRNLYSDDTSLLVHYEVQDNTATDSNINFDTHFIVNPILEKDNVLVTFDFSEKDQFWSANGSMVIDGTSINFQNENICFSNSDNNLIITNDSFNQCEELQKLACNGEIGAKCNKDNADLSKIPSLTVKLEEFEVQFSSEEFMFFDSDNNLSCRIGDPGDLRILDLCDRNTEFALGKMFYQKYYPVLTFKKDLTSSFSFLKTYDFPKEDSESNFWLIFWWILAIIIILAIIVFIVVVRKRQREKNGDDYRNIPVTD